MIARRLEAAATASRAGEWTGSAFGIRLQGDFPAPGLLEETVAPTRSADENARCCHLRLVSGAELDAAWPSGGSTLLGEVRDAQDRRILTIEAHPQAGYRLEASYYGRYLVTGDGRRVLCAPTAIAEWAWQAFVIGQILPLLVVLHGMETLHGSAVAYGDEAIGLVAPSHGGKSSLAMNLVRHGAAFAADDVLALEPAGGSIALHPGPALASVRHAEARAMGPEAVAGLGPVRGRDDHELRVAVATPRRRLRLAALYFLERAEQEPREPVTPMQVDPQLLLCSDLCSYLREPTRLTRQLDRYSQLARTVPTFRAVMWPGIDAHGLAGVIHEHAGPAIGSPA
ncbi:MAG: hypothetical protein M3350_05645 [Actinomycetota bacterium]|nr:hypothetical protein [Actinomycetota bacterium]